MHAAASIREKQGKNVRQRQWTMQFITSPGHDTRIVLCHYEEVIISPTGKRKIVDEWGTNYVDPKTKKLLKEPQVPAHIAQECVNSLVRTIKVDARIGGN